MKHCTTLLTAAIVAVSSFASAQTSPPKRQCIITCRWFDENNHSFMSGMRSLGDGENICYFSGIQKSTSPFVA